ncbi:JHE-like carboxylesterase 1 [Penaeus vannamei]|uniref:JHE-like carboxylesterase 1 n=1 Tax=Penaeus vannamei TaxID=6689 RepID=A0A3R7P7I8_PENVA|nr:JHE-like carboxylesterase 1 [Penaeus vannamei]
MEFLPALFLVALVTPSDQQKITLTQGEILGTEEVDETGSLYHAFRSIPYAQSPTGDLRFKDPVPAKGWDGVRDGSLTPPLCPQLDLALYHAGKKVIRGQEDCLYLNVFTPKDSHTKLPVMVWIHEGAFMVGGASHLSPGPLVSRGVVLVTLHYRLGTLGFLSTEDSVLPGNLGLKDQTLALRWVKDNIRDLGGDPEKVTVFGVSSGAAAAHFQVLTPYAKEYHQTDKVHNHPINPPSLHTVPTNILSFPYPLGLFHRAILQSGSGLCSWGSRADHREVAVKVGQLVNCSKAGSTTESLDSKSLLACLQKTPLEELVAVPQAFAIWSNEPLVMLPRVDGDFLPDFPATLLKNNRYNKVDLIAGVTAHEGAFVAKNSGRPRTTTTHSTFARRVFYHSWGDHVLSIADENADAVTEVMN